MKSSTSRAAWLVAAVIGVLLVVPQASGLVGIGAVVLFLVLIYGLAVRGKDDGSSRGRSRSQLATSLFSGVSLDGGLPLFAVGAAQVAVLGAAVPIEGALVVVGLSAVWFVLHAPSASAVIGVLATLASVGAFLSGDACRGPASSDDLFVLLLFLVPCVAVAVAAAVFLPDVRAPSRFWSVPLLVFGLVELATLAASVLVGVPDASAAPDVPGWAVVALLGLSLLASLLIGMKSDFGLTVLGLGIFVVEATLLLKAPVPCQGAAQVQFLAAMAAAALIWFLRGQVQRRRPGWLR